MSDLPQSRRCAEAGAFRRRFARSALLTGIGYGLLLIVLTLLENYLIFPAPRYPLGNWEPTGLIVEDVFFPSGDGTQLHGWFLDHPEPRGHLLYCHGNGEHVAFLAEVLRSYQELGFAVFAFDYRGYGRSQGSPHERGILADGHAAHDWLMERTGLDPEQIILVGRSLGGAVAVDLAAQRSARCLILESTFTTLPDVAARIYWWVPVRQLMRSRFDSRSKMKHYRGPLLMSHGGLDQLVPVEHGRELFAAAASQRKQFLEIPGHGHNDAPPADYYAAVDRFLAELDGETP